MMDCRRWISLFVISLCWILPQAEDGIISDNLTIYHWNHPPFVIESGGPDDITMSSVDQLPFSGMFLEILDKLVKRCYNTSHIRAVHLRNQNDVLSLNWSRKSPLSPTASSSPAAVGALEVYLPVWAHRHRDLLLQTLDIMEIPYVFVNVVESPGAIHFYRKPSVPVGSDLVTVIVQGWPMLVLILLGAAYSGIIIWLLDRLWNEQNFPKPFLKGFWEGFWWAFVTMTTVGYGDTTPRSIQARMFGLVWIMVGVTILSVFTATVTTVLTQQTLGNQNLIQGSMVAVSNGTDEARLAVQLGAQPVVLSNLTAMLESLRAEQTKAALMEQYSFASIESSLCTGCYLIEKMVSNPVDFGFLFTSNVTKKVKSCMRAEMSLTTTALVSGLLGYVHPLSTHTTSASEKAQKLFQPKTISYMWFALAAWAAIFLLFVIWEFAYWRPKHKKRKAKKEKSQKVANERNVKDVVSQRVAVSTISGRLYRPASAPCLTVSPLEAESTMRLRSQRTPSRKLQNGFLRQSHHARFYANRGFVADSESIGSEPRSQAPSSDHLDDLIRRQTAELRQLEQDFLTYKSQWETKVKFTKNKHKEEQRHFLRLLQTGTGNMSLNDVNAPRSVQLSRRNHSSTHSTSSQDITLNIPSSIAMETNIY